MTDHEANLLTKVPASKSQRLVMLQRGTEKMYMALQTIAVCCPAVNDVDAAEQEALLREAIHQFRLDILERLFDMEMNQSNQYNIGRRHG